MSGEERNSFAVIFLLCMTVAMTYAQENITATTTVVETTTANIELFSVEIGEPIRFLFNVKNTGNTNISVFPQITVYDLNNNTLVVLTNSTAINISIGGLDNLALTWITGLTGNFRAQLVVFYDNNSKIVIAENNFSIPKTPKVPASSSGDGGTVGGTISKESLDNVNLWEMHEKVLKTDVPTSYIFGTPELDITEITITPSKDLGIASLRVEQLKGLSRIEGMISPTHEIYKYINIWFEDVGLKKQDRDAIVSFKVNKDWMARNRIEESTIALLKWDGIKWNLLGTQLKDHDEKYNYYEAKTDSFGVFAISYVPPDYPATPIVQITEIPILTSVPPRPIQTKSSGSYEIIDIILFLLFLYFIDHRKKNKSN